MKDKKQIWLVCLLVLCAMLTGFLQPAAADVKAERLLKRMENLTQVPNTHLLLAQDPKTFQWGVYDTDANVVVPLEYKTISYLDYAGCHNYLIVWKTAPEKYGFDTKSGIDQYISDYAPEENKTCFIEYSHENNAAYGIIVCQEYTKLSEKRLMYKVLGLSSDEFDLEFI